MTARTGGACWRALAFTSLVALSGCARGCTSSRPPIHINPSMDDQPKVLPQTASTFFYDGASMRQPVPGTIPIGGLKEDTAFFTGKGRGREVRRDDPRDRGRRRFSSAAASGTRSIASLATTLEGTARESCSSEATSPPPLSTRTRS